MVTESSERMPTADEFLHARGLEIADYFVEKTPVSELICFKNKDGRVFDLNISSVELKRAVLARLIELGVQIVELK